MSDLKKRLISSILTFFMILSIMLVGVYAAENVTLTLGGTINYEPPIDPSSYLQDSGAYYYIELGQTYGKPMKWRYVGIYSETKDESGTVTATTITPYSTYSADDKTIIAESLGNGTAVFLQEDVPYTSEGAKVSIYWQRNCTTVSSDDEECFNTDTEYSGLNIYANNYKYSDAREYMNGETTNVYNTSTSADGTSDIFTDYSFSETDKRFYSECIIPRSLESLGANIVDCTGRSATVTTYYPSTTLYSGETEQTDKLWLLSYEEYNDLFAATTPIENTWKKAQQNRMFWFRSPYSNYTYDAWYYNSYKDRIFGSDITYSNAPRAAFLL